MVPLPYFFSRAYQQSVLCHMVRARHKNGCALGRRVSARRVMAVFRYCTVLLVHYSELEVFLLTHP